MTEAAKGKSLRRAMAQLHTWVGLPVGWVFFFIFVMGALSFYHQEITVWMTPETHAARPSDTGADHALKLLRQEAPASGPWAISLPNERTPYLTVSWPDPSAARPGERPGMKRIVINPENGEAMEARPTSGGSFLYRLHVQLFGLERMTGMTLIAMVTLVMLLALVSGLFVHRTIFKDFFLFRPRRGKVSWRDAHNATAVFSYPFHIVITLSGLLLLCPTIMTPVISTNYGSDLRSFIMETRGMETSGHGGPQTGAAGGGTRGGRGERGESGERGRGQGAPGRDGAENRRPEMAERDGERSARGSGGENAAGINDGGEAKVKAALAELSPLLLQAGERWPEGAGSITINNPAGPDTTIELRQARADVLRGGSGAAERMVFEGKSGKLLKIHEKKTPSLVLSIWQTLTAIHRGHFAGPLPRFLLFVSGLCGAAMVATGLVLWTFTRKRRLDADGRLPFSHHLVESLNIAVIPGLFIATACYLAGSRLIPAEMTTRVDLERQVFFLAWGLCVIHAMLWRNKKKAWIEQFVVAGTLLVLLPVINAMTGGAHLFQSIASGLWPVAGFDLMSSLLGIVFLLAAGKIFRLVSTSSDREPEEDKVGKDLALEPVPVDPGSPK